MIELPDPLPLRLLPSSPGHKVWGVGLLQAAAAAADMMLYHFSTKLQRDQCLKILKHLHLFHNFINKKEKINSEASIAMISVVFCSPPFLPAGQYWNAESLLHHHLGVVLPRLSCGVCHHGEGHSLNVLQTLSSVETSDHKVPDQRY